MIDLMPKISEKFEQLGGVEKYIEKYGKAEIQYFHNENRDLDIDFSEPIKKLCSMFNMKEITVHPPLDDYDIEVILMYDENIIRKQLENLVDLSNKLDVKINLLFHTHWHLRLHRINTIEKIKNLLKIIEGTQVTLLVENLFMLQHAQRELTALELCKEINNPKLKMCFDICHLYCQANMYKTTIEKWSESVLNKEDCEKYVYQIHFSYTGNNDGYIDKQNTHGIGHPTEELLLKDFKILENYGMAKKVIVTEISEKDYTNRKEQIQDIEWLQNINI